jgi:hypothetical protein
MVNRTGRLLALLLVMVPLAGCSSSPTAPSLTAPQSMTPANGAQVRNSDQPVTLTVQNSTVSGASGSTTYTFEVASDSGFGNKVQTKDGVSAGSAGQTSVTLDVLPAGKDYYWHMRAQSGGTVGPFSATSSFTIGAAVTLNPPTPVSPLTGTSSSSWPTFVVTNATRTGSVGSILYRFEVSNSAAFTTIVLTATMPETPGTTAFVPAANLPAPAQTALYWRAIATDPTSGVSSAASAVQSFTYAATEQAMLAALQGLILWPGTQPTGANGHAVMGANWNIATLVSWNGERFTKPSIEELRVFDLIDRGMDPGAAIEWMKSNGYPSVAGWYPSVQAIGFPYTYVALIGGSWDLVVRVGA